MKKKLLYALLALASFNTQSFDSIGLGFKIESKLLKKYTPLNIILSAINIRLQNQEQLKPTLEFKYTTTFNENDKNLFITFFSEFSFNEYNNKIVADDQYNTHNRLCLKVIDTKNNSTAGLCLFYKINLTPENLLYINHICVNRTYQRKGICRLMINKIITDYSPDKIYLYPTNNTNQIYSRLGFVKNDLFDEDHMMKICKS